MSLQRSGCATSKVLGILALVAIPVGVAVFMLYSKTPGGVTSTTSTASTAPSTANTPSSTSKPSSLSEEDRQLIAKQKICPVSGDSLDSMGEPYRTEVEGRTVFVCCKGCTSALKKNPAKYLANLK
jgi:YHS domain-containing protein